MIDSHCHLTDPRLLAQLPDVLARAKAASVARMITIGTDSADNAAAISLCRQHSNLRCAVGLHPNHCKDIDESALTDLREMQNDPHVLALGEMGLDYHHDVDRARQRKFFEAQLQLAIEVGKPVVIHCRDAVDDCLEILRSFQKIQADFHCFTGTPDEARRILDSGAMIGLTGVVTFKKSDALREVAEFIPADRLLVETDAPYLSPEPMRKQIVNEPALVVHTAAAIATVRGISLQDIDRITTENAMRFFGWIDD